MAYIYTSRKSKLFAGNICISKAPNIVTDSAISNSIIAHLQSTIPVVGLIGQSQVSSLANTWNVISY